MLLNRKKQYKSKNLLEKIGLYKYIHLNKNNNL